MHSAHTIDHEVGAHRRDGFQPINFMQRENGVAGTRALFADRNRQNAYTGF